MRALQWQERPLPCPLPTRAGAHPTGAPPPYSHYCRGGGDEVLDRTCPQNIALKWHTEIGSAVYATPLITDLYSDGRKDILVPGFVHNLEVWGAGAYGWGARVGTGLL